MAIVQPNFTHIFVNVRRAGDNDLDAEAPPARWQPNISNIDTEAVDQETYREFTEEVAHEYRDKVESAIRSDRFASDYTPLKQEYRERKERLDMMDGFWTRTGQMADAITVERHRPTKAFVVGIDPTARYRTVRVTEDGRDFSLGNKEELRILTIAKFLEFGTEFIPARPVFKPILKELQDGASDLWEQFQ